MLRAVFGRARQHSQQVVVGGGRSVVACLGASATAATGSYDWIAELAQRPANAGFRFHRFAEGGDLAYNGLARVPDVIACQPDCVVVLLGDNDVLASISAKQAQFVRIAKNLPETPSPQWYRDNMQAIVRRLKSNTRAHIGLCSLIPIGEDPASTDAFQAEADRRVEHYSAIVKDIAQKEAVSYIPVYERIHELILSCPGRAFTGIKILPFYRDAFRQFVLQKSNDDIGHLNGWRFHRDGIHLNSRGGLVVADAVQEFLDHAGEEATG